MSEEAFQFPPILYTERLTLTLVDFTKDADEQQFTNLLKTMVGEILDVSPEDAAKRAQGSIDFYRSYGRLQPKFLNGCKANQGAIWLANLGLYSRDFEEKATLLNLQRKYCDISETSWGFAVTWLWCISPKSPDVVARVGYVPVEGGLKHVDGVTKLLLYVLPTAAPLPKDLVFSQYARVE